MAQIIGRLTEHKFKNSGVGRLKRPAEAAAVPLGRNIHFGSIYFNLVQLGDRGAA